MGRQMTSRAATAVAMLGVVTVVACSSAPDAAVDQARLAYNRAATNLDVQKYAPIDLQQAQQTLARAEGASDESDADSFAYLAMRQAETTEAIARTRAMQQQIDTAATERGKIQLEAQKKQLQTEQTQARTARQQATAAERQARSLQEQLASLKAQKNDQSTVLTLNDPVFRVGGSELQPGAFSDIDKIATYLKGHPDRTIVVSGYTDNTGSATYNQDLSERRADAVKNALIARGVEPSRIVAHGFGPSAPRAPNDTAAGRQLNRRVEVVVAGPSGQAARAPEMNSQQVSPGVGSTMPQPPR